MKRARKQWASFSSTSNLPLFSDWQRQRLVSASAALSTQKFAFRRAFRIPTTAAPSLLHPGLRVGLPADGNSQSTSFRLNLEDTSSMQVIVHLVGLCSPLLTLPCLLQPLIFFYSSKSACYVFPSLKASVSLRPKPFDEVWCHSNDLTGR